MKTKIDRRLTVLCKLVIFLVVTGFTEIFIVTAPHWRCDDKQEKQAKNDFYEVANSSLQIGYLLGSKKVQREFHRKSSKMWLMESTKKLDQHEDSETCKKYFQIVHLFVRKGV